MQGNVIYLAFYTSLVVYHLAKSSHLAKFGGSVMFLESRWYSSTTLYIKERREAIVPIFAYDCYCTFPPFE